MLAATSKEAVRSRSRTGKHSRQLQSDWTDANLMELLDYLCPTDYGEWSALDKINKAAEVDHEGAKKLLPIGLDKELV